MGNNNNNRNKETNQRNKKQKAEDKNNWKTEWIKEERSEMVQSLATLFNRVEEENKIPIQLREKN